MKATAFVVIGLKSPSSASPGTKFTHAEMALSNTYGIRRFLQPLVWPQSWLRSAPTPLPSYICGYVHIQCSSIISLVPR